MFTDNIANDIAFLTAIFSPMVGMLCVLIGILVRDVRRAVKLDSAA